MSKLKKYSVLILSLIFGLFTFLKFSTAKADTNEYIFLNSPYDYGDNNVTSKENLYYSIFSVTNATGNPISELFYRSRVSNDTGIYNAIKLNGKRLSDASYSSLSFISSGRLMIEYSEDFLPVNAGIYEFEVKNAPVLNFNGTSYYFNDFKCIFCSYVQDNDANRGIFLHKDTVIEENGGTPTVGYTGINTNVTNTINYIGQDFDQITYQMYNNVSLALTFSEYLADNNCIYNGEVETSNNIYNLKYSMGNYVTLNGIPLYYYNRAIVTLYLADNRLLFKFDPNILVQTPEYNYPTLEIQPGVKIGSQILPGVKVIYDIHSGEFKEYSFTTKISLLDRREFRNKTEYKNDGSFSLFVNYTNHEVDIDTPLSGQALLTMGDSENGIYINASFKGYEDAYQGYEIVFDGKLLENNDSGLFRIKIPKGVIGGRLNVEEDFELYFLKSNNNLFFIDKEFIGYLDDKIYEDYIRFTISDIYKTFSGNESIDARKDMVAETHSLNGLENDMYHKVRLSYNITMVDADSATCDNSFFIFRTNQDLFSGLRFGISSSYISINGLNSGYKNKYGELIDERFEYPFVNGETYHFDIYLYDEVKDNVYKDTIFVVFCNNIPLYFNVLYADFSLMNSFNKTLIGNQYGIYLENSEESFKGLIEPDFHYIYVDEDLYIVPNGERFIRPDDPTPPLECEEFVDFYDTYTNSPFNFETFIYKCYNIEARYIHPNCNEEVVDEMYEIIKATCSEDGLYYKSCVCGHIGTDTFVVPMLPHTSGDIEIENSIPSTCTINGSHDEVTYCIFCQAEMTRNNITDDLIPHTPSSMVVENINLSTCVIHGSHDEVIYCSECHAELSRETKEDELIDHINDEMVIENIVKPLCTTDGSYDEVIYCVICSNELSRNTIVDPMLGHIQGERVIENNIPSTCTINGSHDESIYCTRCNSLLSKENIINDLIPHDFEHIEKVNSTCTDAGIDEGEICKECGLEVGFAELPPLGHQFIQTGKVIATCEADGKKAGKYCSICGYKEGGEVIPKLGHLIIEDAEIPATYEKEGRKAGTHCQRCDYTTGREIIPILTDKKDKKGCKSNLSSLVLIPALLLIPISIKKRKNKNL